MAGTVCRALFGREAEGGPRPVPLAVAARAGKRACRVVMAYPGYLLHQPGVFLLRISGSGGSILYFVMAPMQFRLHQHAQPDFQAKHRQLLQEWPTWVAASDDNPELFMMPDLLVLPLSLHPGGLTDEGRHFTRTVLYDYLGHVPADEDTVETTAVEPCRRAVLQQVERFVDRMIAGANAGLQEMADRSLGSAAANAANTANGSLDMSLFLRDGTANGTFGAGSRKDSTGTTPFEGIRSHRYQWGINLMNLCVLSANLRRSNGQPTMTSSNEHPATTSTSTREDRPSSPRKRSMPEDQCTHNKRLCAGYL